MPGFNRKTNIVPFFSFAPISLILFFAIFFTDHAVASHPRFEARQLIDIASREAFRRGNNFKANLFRKMSGLMKSVRMYRRTQSDPECSPGIYAYGFTNRRSEVFLCPKFFYSSRSDKIYVLIHEIAHSAGYRGECDADRITSDILNFSRRSRYHMHLYC